MTQQPLIRFLVVSFAILVLGLFPACKKSKEDGNNGNLTTARSGGGNATDPGPGTGDPIRGGLKFRGFVVTNERYSYPAYYEGEAGAFFSTSEPENPNSYQPVSQTVHAFTFQRYKLFGNKGIMFVEATPNQINGTAPEPIGGCAKSGGEAASIGVETSAQGFLNYYLMYKDQGAYIPVNCTFTNSEHFNCGQGPGMVFYQRSGDDCEFKPQNPSSQNGGLISGDFHIYGSN